jgi:hypothetical protein
MNCKARQGAVGPNLGTIPESAWSDRGKPRQNNPDSRRLNRDSNRAAPGYESTASPLCQPVPPCAHEAKQQSFKCLYDGAGISAINKGLRRCFVCEKCYALEGLGAMLFKTHKVSFLVPVSQNSTSATSQRICGTHKRIGGD